MLSNAPVGPKCACEWDIAWELHHRLGMRMGRFARFGWCLGSLMLVQACAIDNRGAVAAQVAFYIQAGVEASSEMAVMAYHHGLWIYPITQLFKVQLSLDSHDRSSSGALRPDAVFFKNNALCGKLEAKASSGQIVHAARELHQLHRLVQRPAVEQEHRLDRHVDEHDCAARLFDARGDALGGQRRRRTAAHGEAVAVLLVAKQLRSTATERKFVEPSGTN